MQETIVLYPAPGMGHIVSMVELGKLILQHCNHHFSISIFLTSGFWDTPSVVSYVESTSRANPSISFHRFPSLFVDTSPTRSPAAICFEFIRLHDPSVLFSLQDLSKSCKIRAFVIDIFCTSALSIGRKLEIPTFYFYTSGATALAAFLQFPRIYEASPQSFQDLTTTVFHFQGISTSVKATEMPEPTLDRKDPACASFMHFCSSLPTSDGIIINTFEDLEPMAIKAIADGVCVDDGPTPLTYCIGPLIAGGKGQHDCLSWLDRQPSKSVIFLCFGSRGSLTPAQLTEIANALEKGGQRFLWVVKKPPEDEKRKQTEVDDSGVDLGSLLPEGFLEKTKDKGLVVESWAPQIAVLNHDSVGGFVTHCGWNSVLEAVVAGVPMIAWPLYAEQHLNRNILVHNMGMAIPVKQGEEGFVTAAEFEKRVRELMESDTGRKLKERSSKMKHKASAAFEERGSSTKALTKLIQVWKMGLH